jgi:hypothetical protein
MDLKELIKSIKPYADGSKHSRLLKQDEAFEKL